MVFSAAERHDKHDDDKMMSVDLHNRIVTALLDSAMVLFTQRGAVLTED